MGISALRKPDSSATMPTIYPTLPGPVSKPGHDDEGQRLVNADTTDDSELT
jgi:hypothetical protein